MDEAEADKRFVQEIGVKSRDLDTKSCDGSELTTETVQKPLADCAYVFYFSSMCTIAPNFQSDLPYF